MGHLIHVPLTRCKNTFVVHDGIDKEQKFCDVVNVKLPFMSLFILYATSFEDSNIVPTSFSVLTGCF
jgi:hypothetical protein